MNSILTLLNVLLPQMLSLYKTVRGEAKALDANAKVFEDIDLINLLVTESAETEAKAQAILAKLGVSE